LKLIRLSPRPGCGIDGSRDDRDCHGRELGKSGARYLEELKGEGFFKRMSGKPRLARCIPDTRATETTHVVLERRDDLDDECPHGDVRAGGCS